MRPSLPALSLLILLGLAPLACGGDDASASDTSDAVTLDARDAAADGQVDAPNELAEDTAPELPPEGCQGAIATEPLADDEDTTFLRGPFLQSVMGDQAIIVWRVAQPDDTSGCVDYEVDGEAHQACDAPDARGQYEVRLTGLTPGARITYRAAVGDRVAAPFTFEAAPGDWQPVRLAIMADGHNNEETLDVIARQALAEGVDLAFHVGDSVGQPEEAQFDQFLNGLRPLIHRAPLWPVVGNHEQLAPAYSQAFAVPGAGEAPWEETYYAGRVGNVWFAALEISGWTMAEFLAEPTPQEAWLMEQLDTPEAQDATWRFLFIHEPAFAQGWGSCDHYTGERGTRVTLLPLAIERGVDAMFHGHMHGYEHGEVEGVHLFTSGGAGGGLDIACPLPEGFPEPWTTAYVHHHLVVDAGCDELVVEAVDLEGAVIDRVEITRD